MLRRNLSPKRCKARGFTLLEVLVGLGILTAGLISIAAIFPQTMKTSRDAQLLTRAAGLAQMKGEEIKRDNDRTGRMIAEIRALATPTTPIVFPNEPRLQYSFSGRSILYPFNAGDPRSTPGIARVIIRYAPSYRPEQEVIYEYRFN